VAVIVTFVEAATVVVVIEKVAVEAPAATVVLAGTTAAALLLERVTVVADAATPSIVTVPVVVLPPKTLFGSSASERAAGEGRTASTAVRLLPALEAVMVVFPAVVTGSVVTRNVASVDPTGTVMVAGTVARVVTELVSEIVAAASAGALRVTVAVTPKPPVALAWLSVRLARSG
jgi:hypothetical protein